MFAAELLVKNAVKPLSFKHFKISGYGFLRSILNTMIGFVTNTVNKTSTLYYNPSTTLLTAPKYSVNSKVTLEYNATDDSLDFIFV